MNHTGRSDDEQHVGACGGLDRTLPGLGRKRFAEPDDVGPPAAAALVLDRIERERFVERPARGAASAARFAQLPVQFDQVARARAQVQRIDVLRGEGEVAMPRLEFGQREMRG